MENTGQYHFTINWGDRESDLINSWDQTETVHTYLSAGLFTVSINGTISGGRFAGEGDRLKLVKISQWGCLNLGEGGSYFKGFHNLVLTATDDLNLTGLIQNSSGSESFQSSNPVVLSYCTLYVKNK